MLTCTNPVLLCVKASQDLVISTYSILGSDSTYWKKRGGANYVAPLESIAWHRIILDESHSIKQGNTAQTKAAMSLTATNKWCMSGTPICTTPADLISQLQFIGMGCISDAHNFRAGAGRSRRSHFHLHGNHRPVYDFAAPLVMIRHGTQLLPIEVAHACILYPIACLSIPSIQPMQCNVPVCSTVMLAVATSNHC